jgi:hypothetical protein
VPMTCYGYPADLPPGAAKDAGAQAALSGARKMPFSCYSYPIMCVSYPAVASRVIQDRAAAPTAPPGLRRMTYSTCFRY